jgi:pimaricinolide synthase PimS1
VRNLPFSWSDVRLHASGASALRVRLRRAADGVSVEAFDTAGLPVLSARSLVMRPASTGPVAVPVSGVDDALFGVTWMALPGTSAAEDGTWTLSSEAEILAEATSVDVPPVDVPPVVVLDLRHRVAEPADLPGETRGLARHMLGLVQAWLAHERFASARLVVVTSGVASGAWVAGAAVWGLVRSAQAEHPGRFVLVDVEDTTAWDTMMPSVLSADEPEYLVRAGVAYGRRLNRAPGALVLPPGGGWRWSSRGRWRASVS